MAWCSLLPVLLAQAEAAEPQAWYRENWFLAVMALAVVVVPYFLGQAIAGALRMPDYAVRIWLVLCTLLAGVVIVVFGWPPRLGIDLKGGVILVYEVKATQDTSELKQLVTRIDRKLSNSGVGLAQVSLKGNDQLQVTLAKADESDLNRVEETIKGMPFDDFTFEPAERTSQGGQQTIVYNVRRKSESAVDMDKLVGALSKRVNPGGVKEVTIRKYGDRQIEIIVPEVDKAEVDKIKRDVSTTGALEFRITANRVYDKELGDRALRTKSQEVVEGGKVRARWVELDTEKMPLEENLDLITRVVKSGGQEVTQVLMLKDRYDVTGERLVRAVGGVDQTGHPDVNFAFDTKGASLFGQLTGDNLPDPTTGRQRRLGIILDGVLFSAPNIRSTITDQGQITGRFTPEEVEFLVGILNAGSLPAALHKEPISQQQITPQLGADTVRLAQRAMFVSMCCVLAFTLFYYRKSGIIACMALVMNLLLTVAIMILIDAAFTLPGLAGLVLSVAMAVDSNVLIFERMREELERGSTLRMAIRNGFSKATTTIVDSNLTTLITAVVLFWIGTDALKGFAVTLFLGILLSMYTAIYCARVAFDIIDKKKLASTLPMAKMLGKTNIDFLGKRRLAIGASLMVIAIGIGAAIHRGYNLFDIDFTGGTSVQMVLTAPLDIAEVRRRTSEADLPDVTVSGVETTAEEQGKQFKIDTSEPSIDEVKRKLSQAFPEIRKYSMDYGALAMIEPPTLPAEKALSGSNPADDTPPPADTPRDSSPGQTPPPPAASEPASSTPPATETTDEAPPQAPLKEVPVDETEANAAESTEPEEPAGDAPAPEDAPKDSTPAAEKGASAPLPSDNVLAAADMPLLFAQAAPAGKPTAVTPAKAATKPADASPAGQGTAEGSAGAGDSSAAAADEAETEDADAVVVDEQFFAGGTRVPLKFTEPINHDTLQSLIEETITAALETKAISQRPAFEVTNEEFATIGGSHAYNEWELKIQLPPAEAKKIVAAIKANFEKEPVFPAANVIGGKVAGDMRTQAFIALVASCIFIVAYIWVRFQHLMFGLAAIVALVHDVAITVGVVALTAYLAPFFGFLLIDPFKISMHVMAAILTVMGYSLNDTIVVFDRIREVRGKSPDLTEEMVNNSVNQTLGRTLLTGITTMMVLLILYIAGGPGLHAFSFTLLIGVLVGTFSSIYVASPILLWISGGRAEDRSRSVVRSANAQAHAAP